MQKARCHTALRHSAPTACRHTVSGSISLPSSGFFSPFPHGTGSLSVSRVVFSLTRWSSQIQTGFHVSRVTQVHRSVLNRFRLRGYHPLWPDFPDCFRLAISRSYLRSHNPDATRRDIGLGCSRFARHYYGNHYCFLFLRVLRCFSSPGSLSYLCIQHRCTAALPPVGFPIRKSPDQSLFAAPRSLSQLTTSFIASLLPRHPPYALSSLIIPKSRTRSSAMSNSRQGPGLTLRNGSLMHLITRAYLPTNHYMQLSKN